MNIQTKKMIERLGVDAWQFCPTNEGVDHLRKRIAEILVSDELLEDAKEKGYNIHDYAMADHLRPAMGCVHYQDGKAIACNGVVLIIDNAQYKPEYEGKNINRKGVEVEGNYPNWKAVIPADDLQGFEAKVDAKKLRKELAILRSAARMEGSKNPNMFVKVSNPDGGASVKMNAEQLELFMRYIKTKSIGAPIKFNYGRACKITDGENIAIIMPCNWQDGEHESDFEDVRLTDNDN